MFPNRPLQMAMEALKFKHRKCIQSIKLMTSFTKWTSERFNNVLHINIAVQVELCLTTVMICPCLCLKTPPAFQVEALRQLSLIRTTLDEHSRVLRHLGNGKQNSIMPDNDIPEDVVQLLPLTSVTDLLALEELLKSAGSKEGLVGSSIQFIYGL